MATWKELVDVSSSQPLTNKTLPTAALGSSTATTQSASDNSTKVATTAYVDTQAALGDTSLTSAKIWLGNSSNAKAEVSLSGDVTMSNTGAVTIADDSVESSMIEDGGVTYSKIQQTSANTVLVRDAGTAGAVSAKAVTDTQILIGDGTGFTAAALSGDVTMTNAGAVTGAANAIDGSKLSDNIDVAGTLDVTGAATLDSNLSVAGNATVTGNLTVNGSTTSIDTTNLKVEDKLIMIANASSPTPDTADGAGIQVETSGTEAEWPELKWTKDIGASNDGTYDGAGAIKGLTGWSLSNHQASNQADFAIAIMDYKADAGAPSGNSAGIGSLCLNTNDDTLYVRVA